MSSSSGLTTPPSSTRYVSWMIQLSLKQRGWDSIQLLEKNFGGPKEALELLIGPKAFYETAVARPWDIKNRHVKLLDMSLGIRMLKIGGFITDHANEPEKWTSLPGLVG